MQKHEILLVDDDEDEHLIFREALQNIHHSFHCLAANGWQQAEKILTHLKPDFIFLDMNMQGKNGFECLKEIKQKNEFQTVPVYLYSTGINDADCKAAVNIGAEDCIKKPASIEELSTVLSGILNHQPERAKTVR